MRNFALRYVQCGILQYGMCNAQKSFVENIVSRFVVNILSRFVENIVNSHFKNTYGTGGDPTLRVQCLDPPCRGSVLFLRLIYFTHSLTHSLPPPLGRGGHIFSSTLLDFALSFEVLCSISRGIQNESWLVAFCIGM